MSSYNKSGLSILMCGVMMWQLGPKPTEASGWATVRCACCRAGCVSGARDALEMLSPCAT
jgi:hypothetical protein